MPSNPIFETLKLPELEALAKRRQLATASDTIRGMFVTHALECVNRVLGPQAVAQMQAEAGVPDPKPGLLAKVPMTTFIDVQTVAARHMTPRLGSTEESLYRIGSAAVEIFFETIVGRTMKLLAGDDPHRLLNAAPNGYEFGVSFGKRTYEKTGPRSGTFRFENELMGPCHQLGTFDAAFQGVHGSRPTMKLEQFDVARFNIHVSW